MEPRYDLIGCGWAGELAKPRPRGEIVIAESLGGPCDIVTLESERRALIVRGGRAVLAAIDAAQKIEIIRCQRFRGA